MHASVCNFSRFSLHSRLQQSLYWLVSLPDLNSLSDDSTSMHAISTFEFGWPQVSPYLLDDSVNGIGVCRDFFRLHIACCQILLAVF